MQLGTAKMTTMNFMEKKKNKKRKIYMIFKKEKISQIHLIYTIKKEKNN